MLTTQPQPRALLQSVIDWLDGHSLPTDRPTPPLVPTRFSMASGISARECGAVCCIAGAAVLLSGPLPQETADLLEETGDVSWSFLHTEARSLLGLGPSAAKALFVPEGFTSPQIRPAHAVKVLEHLRDTGEVDWSVSGLALFWDAPSIRSHE